MRSLSVKRRLVAFRNGVFAMLGIWGIPVVAEDINWSSTFFAAVNQDSLGNELDASYVFYLGTFNPPAPVPGEDPWIPLPSNTDEWSRYWITADAISYNTITSNFASSYEVISLVEGVNLTGKQGYIWGVNRAHPDGEWILMTHPSWIWPAPGAGGIGGFGLNWTVAESLAVLGQVDQGGLHMRTALVSGSLPPLLRASIWQQTYFTQNEIVNEEATVSGWLADPNQNGRPNLLEFAFGSHPLLAQQDDVLIQGFLERDGEFFQTLTVARNPNSEVVIAAEVTGNLLDWFSEETHVVLESTSEGALIFRDLTPRSPAVPFRGVRVRVTLP